MRSVRRIAGFTAFLVCAVCVVSCGTGGGGGSAAGPGTLVRSAAGGTVTSGNVNLVVPPASLAADTTISITGTSTGLPAAPAGMALVPGTANSFSPDGTSFSVASTLTIQYDASKLPTGADESSIAIYTVTNGAWTAATGSSVNTTSKTVSASIGHFSLWAALVNIKTSACGGTSLNTTYICQTVGSDENSLPTNIGAVNSVGAQLTTHPAYMGVPQPAYVQIQMADDAISPSHFLTINVQDTAITVGTKYFVRTPTLTNAYAMETPPSGSAVMSYVEGHTGKAYYGTSGYVVVDEINTATTTFRFHLEQATFEGGATLNLQNRPPNFQGGTGIFNMGLIASCVTASLQQ